MPRAKRIWIDTDIALGADHGDVDDGFALAAMVRAGHAFELARAVVNAEPGSELDLDDLREKGR